MLRTNLECAALKQSFPSILKDHIKAIKLLVLAAISYFTGLFTHSDWLCLIAFGITSILFFSFLYASIYGSADAHRFDLPPIKVRAGQEIMTELTISYIFGNTSNCTYAEYCFPDGIICKTRHFIKNISTEKYAAQLKLKFNKKGLYNIFAVKLKHSDPLGLFYKYSMVYCQADILVMPAQGKSRQYYAYIIKTGENPSNNLGTSTDLRNIRDYIYGEDTRYIHWASSAKFGMLMTREFTQESLDNILIIIENDAAGICDPCALDKLITCASQIIEQNKRFIGEIKIACALPSFGNRLEMKSIFANYYTKEIIKLQKHIDKNIKADKRCLYLHKASEDFLRSIYPQLNDYNIEDDDLIHFTLNENSPWATIADTEDIISLIAPVAPLPYKEWVRVAESVPEDYRKVILTLHPNSRIQHRLQSTRQHINAISFYEPMTAHFQKAPAFQNRELA